MALFDALFNMTNLQWTSLIPLFFLALMRLGPIVALAPFFGAKISPMMVRIGIAIFLAIFFMPVILKHAQAPFGFTNAFIGYALKELLVGFILGFLIIVPFYMVQSSGIIIDYLRGASIMQMQDPAFQNQASPLGIFYNFMLIVIFLNIDGPFLLFEGLSNAYEILPADRFINPAFFKPNVPFWKTATDLANQIMTIAIQLAGPALVAILMAEMFLGIANRLAPQVQIAFLGMSIKSLLGLAVLWAGWFFILKQFTNQAYSWLETINRMIQSFRLLVLPIIP